MKYINLWSTFVRVCTKKIRIFGTCKNKRVGIKMSFQDNAARINFIHKLERWKAKNYIIFNLFLQIICLSFYQITLGKFWLFLECPLASRNIKITRTTVEGCRRKFVIVLYFGLLGVAYEKICGEESQSSVLKSRQLHFHITQLLELLKIYIDRPVPCAFEARFKPKFGNLTCWCVGAASLTEHLALAGGRGQWMYATSRAAFIRRAAPTSSSFYIPRMLITTSCEHRGDCQKNKFARPVQWTWTVLCSNYKAL